MYTFLTRTAVAVSSVVLITSCGTGSAAQDLAPRAVSQERAAVDASGTYDGWVVRLHRDSTPPPCHWSPDQVERMQESGRPLPGCVRRLQHWFQQEYDPGWLWAGRADR